MDSVLIVLPILFLLMFDLGLVLKPGDFAMIFHRPKALIAGLIGQILLLPALAIIIGSFCGLEGWMFLGLLLIACCPGGSSSNVFTGIAHGDVALSVSLTAFSSVITLVTLPMFIGAASELPVMNLVIQNLVLVLLPIVLGMMVKVWRAPLAEKWHSVLKKIAFPALMLLAGIFFVVNFRTVCDNFTVLAPVVTLLLLLGMLSGQCLGNVFGLNGGEKRTLVIEVGMQNAAQAMALAASPYVLNWPELAIPATVYALMMNVVLLTYVAIVGRTTPR